jgi:predicted RNase H-like nuclease (RuvC/YqgF family)
MNLATENKALRKEVERLKKEVAAHRKAESDALSKNSRAEAAEHSAHAEVQTLKESLEELTCQIEEEKQKVKNLEAKNQELTVRIK